MKRFWQALYQLAFYLVVLDFAVVSCGSCLSCVRAGEGAVQETRTTTVTTEQWLSGIERENQARQKILDRIMEGIHREQAQRAVLMNKINDRLINT